MTADSGVLTDLMVEITATILMTYETHGSSNDSYDLPNTYCDSQTPRWPPMTLYPDIYTQQSPPHTHRIGLHCIISKTWQHASSKIWARKRQWSFSLVLAWIAHSGGKLGITCKHLWRGPTSTTWVSRPRSSPSSASKPDSCNLMRDPQSLKLPN